MNKAAIYICHKFVCGYMFKYLGVELLSFMISICGALEETESSEVSVPLCILTSNGLKKFQLCHILVNAWYCCWFSF